MLASLALLGSLGCSPDASAPGPGATSSASAGSTPQSPTPRPPTPRRATPERSSVPVPTPTSTKTEPPSKQPGPPDRSLRTNSVYRLDLDDRVVRCSLQVRSPQPPLRNADLAPYLRTVVKCLVKAFAEPLADQGFELSTPKVKTYRSRISTPCGKYGQTVAPAYYCSVNQTIYWPQTSDDNHEAYTVARLGYVGLLAHEFGHPSRPRPAC